jgi:hypothetical protein
METPPPTSSPQIVIPPEQSVPIRLWSDAIRFWEPRRLLYNLVLAAIVLVWLMATWPHFLPAFNLPNLLRLAVLGLIANVLYCAAYFVDLPFQLSSLGARWRSRRWILWVLGMLLAFLLTNYWIADEIYPDFR